MVVSTAVGRGTGVEAVGQRSGAKSRKQARMKSSCKVDGTVGASSVKKGFSICMLKLLKC